MSNFGHFDHYRISCLETIQDSVNSMYIKRFFFFLIHVSVTGVIIKYKLLDEVSVSCSVTLLKSTLAKTFVFIYADPSDIC